MSKKADPPAFLLALNGAVFLVEQAEGEVVGPRLPPKVKKAGLVTSDYLRLKS